MLEGRDIGTSKGSDMDDTHFISKEEVIAETDECL
jgi:hypothetical protein